jgi:hypothetical protein
LLNAGEPTWSSAGFGDRLPHYRRVALLPAGRFALPVSAAPKVAPIETPVNRRDGRAVRGAIPVPLRHRR